MIPSTSLFPASVMGGPRPWWSQFFPVNMGMDGCSVVFSERGDGCLVVLSEHGDGCSVVLSEHGDGHSVVSSEHGDSCSVVLSEHGNVSFSSDLLGQPCVPARNTAISLVGIGEMVWDPPAHLISLLLFSFLEIRSCYIEASLNLVILLPQPF